MQHLAVVALLVCIDVVSPTFAAADSSPLAAAQPAVAAPPAPAATQPAIAPQPAPLAAASLAADPSVESTASRPTAVAADSLSGATPANDSATDDAVAKAAAARAEERKYRNQGYKPHVMNGETYWCKSESLVGSRLPTTICFSVAQLQWQELQGQDTVRGIQRLNTGTHAQGGGPGN